MSLSYWIALYHNLDIVKALRNESIRTSFQPILECKTLKLHGHEALTRAYNESNQVISTPLLFEVAKKLDLTFTLDRLCRLASIKNANNQSDFRGKLFINFVPSVIYDPDVCLRTTHAALNTTNLKPEDVVFEVVESENIEDYEHLSHVLNYYRRKGYKTALDDVGSGFATLVNYDKLKTDYIKLDIDIIRNIHKDTSKQTYLQGVLKLKEKTGVKLIAEGIEYKEEYDYLKSKDIDFVQGYYFAKPANHLYEGGY